MPVGSQTVLVKQVMTAFSSLQNRDRISDSLLRAAICSENRRQVLVHEVRKVAGGDACMAGNVERNAGTEQAPEFQAADSVVSDL